MVIYSQNLLTKNGNVPYAADLPVETIHLLFSLGADNAACAAC